MKKIDTTSTKNQKTKPKRKLKSRSKSKPPVITLNLGDDQPQTTRNAPNNTLKPPKTEFSKVKTTTAKGTKVIEFTIEKVPYAPSKPKSKKNRLNVSEVDQNCRSENEEPRIRLEPDSGAFDIDIPFSNTNGTKPFKSR